jgi:hypothetical protein
MLLLPVILLAGCSTFEQRWEKTPVAAPQASWLQGRWDGMWKSDLGHGQGNLKAIIVPAKNRDTFSATFKATYWKVMTGEYTVEMTGLEQPDGKVKFHGTKDLGAMAGGLYTYDGWADAESFEATYASKHDRGTFKMKRAR